MILISTPEVETLKVAQFVVVDPSEVNIAVEIEVELDAASEE